jgi:molybdenum cofactor cytidylyltransferase
MTADRPMFDIDDIEAGLDDPAIFDTTVVGVLLASGTSSRFGESNKLLATLDGEPLVRHAARTLLGGDLDGVVAVVGYEAETVRAALADLDIESVVNPDFRDGLSTTVERGVETAREADAIVFLPGDMPTVDAETVRTLVDAYRAGLGTALAAAFQGHRGNPVLFERSHFDALRAVEGDVGGLPVFLDADDSGLVETGDAGVVADVDRPVDLDQHQ